MLGLLFSHAFGAVYYITATDSGYTSDGTNSWNPLNETFLETVTTSGNEISLNDSTGSSSAGLTISTTVAATDNALQSYDTAPPANVIPALSWFSNVAGQTDYFTNRNNVNGVGQLTISGFNATDTISIQWIANHSQTNNTRLIDVTMNGAFSNVLSGNAVSSDDFVTQANKDQYMEWSTISPDASGNLVIDFDARDGDAFAAALTAARIEVVPEPSTIMLVGLSLVSLFVTQRRRA